MTSTISDVTLSFDTIYHKFRFWCAQDGLENPLKILAMDTDKYLLVIIIRCFARTSVFRQCSRKTVDEKLDYW